MTRKDVHNSDIPVVCAACEARHKGVCGALSPEELLTLARTTRKGKFAPGDELIAEEQSTDSYANIMHGVVKLTKVLEDGRQQLVGLQFAPDFLGRPFAPSSTVTAQSASDVETCAFPRSTLERLMRDNPELEHKLLEQTLRELDEAREWMVTLGRKSATEKVASFLLLIASHIDPLTNGAPATDFDLPLTRADIADFLGLTIETVSRQFTRLRKDGIIELHGTRQIRIPDIDRLVALCG